MKKNFSTRKQSPFSRPKLVEDKKKGLHSNLVRFLGRKIRVFTEILSSNFLPKLQRGVNAAILHTILRELYYPADPKGAHGTMPPPKYAPGHNVPLRRTPNRKIKRSSLKLGHLFFSRISQIKTEIRICNIHFFYLGTILKEYKAQILKAH